jgi:hypothetical protein
MRRGTSGASPATGESGIFNQGGFAPQIKDCLTMAVTDDERFNLEILLPTEKVAGYGWLDKEGEILSLAE